MFNQKGIGSIAITIVVALIVIGGGVFYLTQDKTPSPTIENNDSIMEDKQNTTDNTSINGGGAISDDEVSEDSAINDDAMKKDDQVTNNTGSYEAYDATKVAQAATDGKAVLFFHANWCPTCRALNSNIESNLSKIPSGVTIFKTDYDTQTALKKKYGITYQHTMVQVDAEGNQITKWSGSPTLNDLISKIK